jgi:hypothetical protein
MLFSSSVVIALLAVALGRPVLATNPVGQYYRHSDGIKHPDGTLEAVREKRRELNKRILEKRGIRFLSDYEYRRKLVDLSQDLHPRELRHLVAKAANKKERKVAGTKEEDFWNRFLQGGSIMVPTVPTPTPPAGPPTPELTFPTLPPAPAPVPVLTFPTLPPAPAPVPVLTFPTLPPAPAPVPVLTFPTLPPAPAPVPELTFPTLPPAPAPVPVLTFPTLPPAPAPVPVLTFPTLPPAAAPVPVLTFPTLPPAAAPVPVLTFPTLPPAAAPVPVLTFPTLPPASLPTLSPVGLPVSVPTFAPVAAPLPIPTLAPAPVSVRASEVILPVALFAGTEFSDPETYQSKSLAWLESSNLDGYSDAQIIQRYALGSIYYATNNVSTTFTDMLLGAGKVFPWNMERAWLTDTDECTWSNVRCDNVTGFIRRIDFVSTVAPVPSIALTGTGKYSNDFYAFSLATFCLESSLRRSY